MYYQLGLGISMLLHTITVWWIFTQPAHRYSYVLNGLYIMVTSVPPFLSCLFLLENMSGIDQRFLHYIRTYISYLNDVVNYLLGSMKIYSTFTDTIHGYT